MKNAELHKNVPELEIHEEVSLLPLNTFHIDVNTRYFVNITHPDQIKNLINLNVFKENQYLILGGGSNILLTQDFNGLVIKIDIKGIKIDKETNDHVWIQAGAGEVWNDLVNFCVGKRYGGIENLVLIPGTVGAAPMQNIGAYGVEICEVFDKLEAVDIKSGETKVFKNKDCKFSYRNSIFKTELKNRFIITKICLKLRKIPVLNTSYNAVQQALEGLKQNSISISTIADIISQIRLSKLPNPDKIGNAGSFFKNPIINTGRFNELKKKYSDIPAYIINEEEVKIPAAWLIEKVGWKGKRIGDAGTAPTQALVIVNYGKAKGKDIFEFSNKIRNTVFEKFKIELETEVNII